jgi:hypothetical protein
MRKPLIMPALIKRKPEIYVTSKELNFSKVLSEKKTIKFIPENYWANYNNIPTKSYFLNNSKLVLVTIFDQEN